MCSSMPKEGNGVRGFLGQTPHTNSSKAIIDTYDLGQVLRGVGRPKKMVADPNSMTPIPIPLNSNSLTPIPYIS